MNMSMNSPAHETGHAQLRVESSQTKSEPRLLPLIKKKKAPVSFATARAIRVFPVPGGP